MAWAMWFNRNEVWHGGRKKSVEALFQWSCQYLQEFQEANQADPIPVVPQVVRQSPPPTARYKVNVDSAIFSAKKSAGVGVMIRDSNGQVIAALCRKLNSPLGAQEVEAKAFEVGLEFAQDVGVHDFILEGGFFGGLQCTLWFLYTTIYDSTCDMRYFDVLWAFRQNQFFLCAHFLVKHALSIADYLTWMKETPCFLDLFMIYLLYDFS